MNIIEIIEKKKQKLELNKEEINYFVTNYIDGVITDYQTSALLMAICLNGMTENETITLTKAYIDSGETIDLSSLESITVDKHSTGGVGDKTSLILGPILATFGLSVAKMSGRGLGHTGGTIDKLESIPGFKTELSKEDFLYQVKKINLSIIGQTGNIVPADKKIYALRDVTATVDSIPLIAASVMSKKIASGSQIIILDIKYGSGAFMKTADDAEKLADILIKIGNGFNRKTIVVISTMEQPLGNKIGNNLEIEESIDLLKGHGPSDLKEVVYTLVGEVLIATNLATDLKDAFTKIDQKIESNEAYLKFSQFVEFQGGDPKFLDNIDQSNHSKIIKMSKNGYIKSINTSNIGLAAMHLGAGRQKLEDIIDPTAGITWFVKIGDRLNVGDDICEIHYNSEENIDNVIELIHSALEITDEHIDQINIIEKIMA